MTAPASASAATADGTVVGEPAVRGAAVVVPVALTAPSFRQLDRGLAAARAATQAALAQVATVTAPTVADGIAADPAGIRAGLLAVRGGVNDRIRDLRAQARGLDAALGRIGPRQRAAPALAAARDTATRVAAALDEAVAVLDERINDVGGLSHAALPIETTSAVSKVLSAIPDLLRDAP